MQQGALTSFRLITRVWFAGYVQSYWKI